MRSMHHTRLHFENLESRDTPTSSSLPSLDQVGIDLDRYSSSHIVIGLHEGAIPLSEWDNLGANLFRAPTMGMEVETALTVYADRPEVAFAEPDYQVQIASIPNDPGFDLLWGLDNFGQNGGTPGLDIGASEAWQVSTGDGSVVVAVIDTGIDYTHPDLADNIWVNSDEILGNGIDDDRNGYIDDLIGWDFANNDNNPFDDNGHGTHVAGTIGAIGDNDRGIAGVVWDVQLMPLKFLDANGSGFLSGAVSALNYAVANGADVSNNSYGGGGFINAMFQAIENANANGHIFVAAAGNSASNNDVNLAYPANYNLPNVISVAAVDRQGDLASFTNVGANSVDLAAPGVNIVSTYPGNQYAQLSGTSMAAPHVSGTVALLQQLRPDWSPQAIIEHLYDQATSLGSLAGQVASGALVDAGAAVSSLNDTDSGNDPTTEVPPSNPDSSLPPPPSSEPTPPEVPPQPPAPPVPPTPVTPPTPPVGGDPGVPPPVPTPPDAPTFTGPSFAVGSGFGAMGIATLNEADGSVRFSVAPFGLSFTGGVRVATGDVNGDGVDDLLTASGPGRVGEVRVFDGRDGDLLFGLAAFESSFTGGVYVSAADFNGDGLAEVVIAPDEGGGPRVRVIDGQSGAVIADFFGIEDANFRGGARLATGDVNGDGVDDLLVAAGFGGGPRVAGYAGQTLVSNTPVKLFTDFFVFESSLRNGIFLAADDVDGDGRAELIAGAGPGGAPRVLILSGTTLVDGIPVNNLSAPLNNFFAGEVRERDGVRVAAKDLSGDGIAEVIVGLSEAGVHIFAGMSLDAGQAPEEMLRLGGFTVLGGVFVG